MNYVYRMYNSFKYYYSTINPAILSGAIDVIVVEQPDGSYLATPFHVRFGKWAVFNVDDKYVDIQINSQTIENVKMKLGNDGVAFFVEEILEDEDLPNYLITSPIPTSASAEQKAEKFKLTNDLDRSGPKQEFNKFCVPSCSDDVNDGDARTNQIKNLAFSSSIFSCRKNRSLPNLSIFNQSKRSETDEIASKQITRKLTVVDMAAVQQSNCAFFKAFELNKPLKADKALNLINGKPYDLSTSCTEFDSGDELSELLYSDATEETFSDSEAGNQRVDKIDQQVEWHWGELPKTTVQAIDNFKSSYWSWLGWQSNSTVVSQSTDQDDVEKLSTSRSKSIGIAIPTAQNDSGLGSSPETPSSMLTNLRSQQFSKKSTTCKVSRLDSRVKKVPTPQKITKALCKTNIVGPQTFDSKQDKTSRTTLESKRGFAGKPDVHCRDRPFRTTLDALSNSTIANDSRYKRTLRLKSDQLKDLQLKYGSNDARFSISNKFQGTAWCCCHIYLLKWDEKIVISDVDGTITKSDVLGHIIPAIGGTWAHTNIVDIYSKIRNNGYRIIYLSSRAIGQSYQTKRYLSSVVQDSKTLPDGPVLLSPTSVLMALRKEVIERKPEEFKIACLNDLLSLFPGDKPFYAGFGNRLTDMKSYLAVDIRPERILIIDPSGSVKNATTRGFSTNYNSMLRSNLVDHFFPPLTSSVNTFNDASTILNFWRTQDDSVDSLDLEKYEIEQRQRQVQRMRNRLVNNRIRLISV